MRIFAITFLVALAVTSISTPWVRRMASALGFVDAPAGRKLHRTPMPLMGGVAIFGGVLIILALYFRNNRDILGVLAASALISAIGLIDDKRPLRPILKFGGQIIAFAIAIYFGVQVHLAAPLWVNYGITFLWLAVITNAINFLDNMDGLCAGVSAVAAAFTLLLALLNDQYVIAPISAAVLGACLGFLRYNFKPARIFMGDAGSLLLGFLLAVMSLQLRFPEHTKWVTWMVPAFILGVPLFDLGLIMVARLGRGVNPLTTAGKDHTSHRLVRIGFSQREAVLTLYLLGGVFGMVAIFLTRASLTEAYFTVAAAILIALVTIRWFIRKTGLK